METVVGAKNLPNWNNTVDPEVRHELSHDLSLNGRVILHICAHSSPKGIIYSSPRLPNEQSAHATAVCPYSMHITRWHRSYSPKNLILEREAKNPASIEMLALTNVINDTKVVPMKAFVLQSTVTRDVPSLCEIHHENFWTIALISITHVDVGQYVFFDVGIRRHLRETGTSVSLDILGARVLLIFSWSSVQRLFRGRFLLPKSRSEWNRLLWLVSEMSVTRSLNTIAINRLNKKRRNEAICRSSIS